MAADNALALGFFIRLPAFLIALVVHEYAHGFAAYKRGDNTAKHMGRLTLNPLAHIDLFGTIILPLSLLMLGAIPIGYAKPVPINFQNLHNPKKDIIWVGAAGPLANFITAGAVFIILNSGLISNGLLSYFLSIVLLVNIMIGAFNLIPIPPLDGSRILLGILPNRWALKYMRLERYGIIIIYVLLWFVWRVLR